MGNKEKNFISAVVYVHNSEKEIKDFLYSIIDVLEDCFEHSEIICVNDASVDASVDIIRKVSGKATSTSVSVVNMSYYQGLEISMNAGLDISIGDFVFEFDSCILDFELKEIMEIYKLALKGYDIVSAVPNRKERLSSKLFYKLFFRYADHSELMHTERFRILSRRVINRVFDMNKSTPYRKVLYARQGLKVTNIVYDVVGTNLAQIKDKKERKYRRNLAIESLILFTNFGYRFSIGMAFLMMLMMVAMLVYTVVAYIVSHPVEGWTSTILFLSVAFFGVFGIFAVIIKYLEIILNLIFKRKQYVFESIEKLTK